MDSPDSCDDTSTSVVSALEDIKKEVNLLLAAGVDAPLPLGTRPRNPAVLIHWIDDHSRNPYPNKDEKRVLAYYAGMTQRQLNDWFANARRNIKKVGYSAWKEKHSAFSARFSARFSALPPMIPDSGPGMHNLHMCKLRYNYLTCCLLAAGEGGVKHGEASSKSSTKQRAVIKPIPHPRNFKQEDKTSSSEKFHHSGGFHPYLFHSLPPHSSPSVSRATTMRHAPVNHTPAFYKLHGVSFPNSNSVVPTLGFSGSRSSNGQFQYSTPPTELAPPPPPWNTITAAAAMTAHSGKLYYPNSTKSTAALPDHHYSSIGSTIVDTIPVSSNDIILDAASTPTTIALCQDSTGWGRSGFLTGQTMVAPQQLESFSPPLSVGSQQEQLDGTCQLPGNYCQLSDN